MLVVLIVVPAVMAIQADALRPLTSVRRALRGRALRGLVLPVALAMLALFAATVGWVAVTGGFWLPVAAALPPMVPAFGLFAMGSAGLALGGLAVGAFVARPGSLSTLQQDLIGSEPGTYDP